MLEGVRVLAKNRAGAAPCELVFVPGAHFVPALPRAVTHKGPPGRVAAAAGLQVGQHC